MPRDYPIFRGAVASVLFSGGRESRLITLLAFVGYLLLCLDWSPGGGFLSYILSSVIALVGWFLLLIGLLAATSCVKASWARGGATGQTFFAVVAAVAGVAVIWGVLRIVWLGPLSFHIGGSLFFREWIVSTNPDLAVFVGLTMLGALAGQHSAGPKGRAVGAFWGCAMALVVVANAYFLGVADFSILMTPDSPSYLYRNSCRAIGYLILLTPFKVFDGRILVAFQLNLILLSQVAVAWAVLQLTRSVLTAIATLMIATLFCYLYSLSFYVMTEATFAAAIGFIVAGAITYIASTSLRSASVVGVATAAAIGIKAAAPPLIIAVLPLLLRSTTNRRLKAVAILGPPVACLLALTVWGRVANGTWSPTNFSGYALAENVAWAIQKDPFSTEPELSAAIEEKLQPFAASWPSPWDASAYLIHSMDNLDVMFWNTLLPVVLQKYPPPPGSQGCTPTVNDALMKLGTNAVRRNPLRYAEHVAVQFYGLWAFALVPQKWADHPGDRLNGIGEPTSEWEWRAAPAKWRPGPERQAFIDKGYQDAGVLKYADRTLFLDRIKTLGTTIGAPIGATPAVFTRPGPQQTGADPKSAQWRPRQIYMWQYFAGTIAIAMVLTSALVFRMHRLSPEVAALVIIALLINGFFGTQALFMFAAPRYSACAEVALAGLLAIFAFVATRFAMGPLASRARVLWARRT